MHRRRGFIISLIIFIYIFAASLNNMTISAHSKSPGAPTPVVSGLRPILKPGETMNIYLTSTGITSMVQYKAVLTNSTTGKTIDLLNGFTKKYYDPRYKYNLSIKLEEGGEYSLIVSSKPAGYKDKYGKSVNMKFEVYSKSLKIDRVNPVIVNIMEGNTYSMPDTIDAVMEDGSGKRVNVEWDEENPDMDNPGMYIFYGSVKGYDGRALLVLNIEARTVIPVIYPPKLVNVSFSSNSEIVLEFSKPIREVSNAGIEIRSGDQAVKIRQGFEGIGTSKLRVFIESPIVRNTKYSIHVKGFFDFDGIESPEETREIILADEGRLEAGYLKAPMTYSPQGEFLYFGSIPLNADQVNAKYDSEGIPMVLINNKFVYNPVNIAQYGLQQYSYYINDGDAKRLENILKCADWLVSHQDTRSGKWLYDFPFDVAGIDERLESGWSSAMGQGQAISLLVRAYYMTKDIKYLACSELGLESLKIDVKNGGLVRDFEGYKFYEEYPTNPPSYALNGFMFTLFGLYDLSIVNPNSGAVQLYKDGMETLKHVLPHYDDSTAKISIYHLGHITKPPRNEHTSDFYHLVHIIQLNAFYSITDEQTFKHYSDLWKSYIE